MNKPLNIAVLVSGGEKTKAAKTEQPTNHIIIYIYIYKLD